MGQKSNLLTLQKNKSKELSLQVQDSKLFLKGYVFLNKFERMLTKKNIWSIRPGTGIPSQYFDKLIGKKIMKSIKKGKLLEKKHINIKLK